MQQMAGIMISYNPKDTIGCVIAQGFTQDAINYADEKGIIWATSNNFEMKLQDALEKFPSTKIQELKLGTVRVKTENRTEPKLISVPVPVRVKEPKTEPNRRFNPKCI